MVADRRPVAAAGRSAAVPPFKARAQEAVTAAGEHVRCRRPPPAGYPCDKVPRLLLSSAVLSSCRLDGRGRGLDSAGIATLRYLQEFAAGRSVRHQAKENPCHT